MARIGYVRNVSALGYSGLKTGSEYSFATREVVHDSGRSLTVTVLANLCWKTLSADPYLMGFILMRQGAVIFSMEVMFYVLVVCY